jgi:hypothetical protein
MIFACLSSLGDNIAQRRGLSMVAPIVLFPNLSFSYLRTNVSTTCLSRALSSVYLSRNALRSTISDGQSILDFPSAFSECPVKIFNDVEQGKEPSGLDLRSELIHNSSDNKQQEERANLKSAIRVKIEAIDVCRDRHSIGDPNHDMSSVLSYRSSREPEMRRVNVLARTMCFFHSFVFVDRPRYSQRLDEAIFATHNWSLHNCWTLKVYQCDLLKRDAFIDPLFGGKTVSGLTIRRVRVTV